MPCINREARNCGYFLKLNAHPERLDFLDTYYQMAEEEGVLISIIQMRISRMILLTFALASDKHDVVGWKNKTYSIHAH